MRSIKLTVLLALVQTTLAIEAWTPPLSTLGRYIVDANGNRFKLKSGNWHGASGTYSGSGDVNDDASHHASENAHTMPLGLQYVSIDSIIAQFDAAGINSIRLPFSNEMIHDTTIVQDAWVAANPQLRGLTPIQVYDKVVEALTAKGFAVILNNHTNKSKWCCGVLDGNEFWNESQSEETWMNDWLFMVNRYKSNARVAGADLYNEVRRDAFTDPSWGSGSSGDWFRASQAAGDRILLDGNPNILIIIEGINWTGLPIDGFAHDRPTLAPVAGISHSLVRSNKLVYAAHFYGYTGPHHSGATGIGETTDPRYRDLSQADLFSTMHNQAGYIALDVEKHYTGPVWFSEFGASRDANSADAPWFRNMITYLIDNDFDFAIWPLVGYLSNGSGNNWALHNWDLALNKFTPTSEDYRWSLWQGLVNNSKEKKGLVDRAPKWDMLNMDNVDFVQSATVRTRGDWDNGARKAVCPDGMHLVGVSNAAPARGICSDRGFTDASTSPTTTGVWGEQYVSTDWAGGFTKLECPVDNYVIGYSVRGSSMSGALCASVPTGRSINKSSGRTVWFDRGDNGLGDSNVGDWASGSYKGMCNPSEIVTGIAFRKILNSGPAASVFCRTLV